MRKGVTVLAILMVLIPVCGCIGGDSTTTEVPTTTVAPTTVPPNVDTTLVRASDVQAALEEYEPACEMASIKMQESRETLTTLLEAPALDYEALYLAFENFKAAVTEYESAVFGHLRISILLEHTTPIEGDLLMLKKETLPFSRPGGKTCTYGELEGWGTSYWHLTDRIRYYIREGIDDYDSRDDIIESLAKVDELLVQYHDKCVGYIYYDVSIALFRQSLYSDVLIRDCNPSCIWVSHPRTTDTSTPPPTTPPSTPPFFMKYPPLSATDVQALAGELQELCHSGGESVQEMLGTLHTMAKDSQPDYTALGKQFSEFKSALSKYLSAQERYYEVKIVLEHTTPTEDGFLEIQKGTIPFDRPDGEMYDLDAGTIARESYQARINRFDWLLYRGFNGEDVREDLAERLEALESFLPENYDIRIGNVYYDTSETLCVQSLYSDVLRGECYSTGINIPTWG